MLEVLSKRPLSGYTGEAFTIRGTAGELPDGETIEVVWALARTDDPLATIRFTLLVGDDGLHARVDLTTGEVAYEPRLCEHAALVDAATRDVLPPTFLRIVARRVVEERLAAMTRQVAALSALIDAPGRRSA